MIKDARYGLRFNTATTTLLFASKETADRFRKNNRLPCEGFEITTAEAAAIQADAEANPLHSGDGPLWEDHTVEE